MSVDVDLDMRVDVDAFKWIFQFRFAENRRPGLRPRARQRRRTRGLRCWPSALAVSPGLPGDLQHTARDQEICTYE